MSPIERRMYDSPIPEIPLFTSTETEYTLTPEEHRDVCYRMLYERYRRVGMVIAGEEWDKALIHGVYSACLPDGIVLINGELRYLAEFKAGKDISNELIRKFGGFTTLTKFFRRNQDFLPNLLRASIPEEQIPESISIPRDSGIGIVVLSPIRPVASVESEEALKFKKPIIHIPISRTIIQAQIAAA